MFFGLAAFPGPAHLSSMFKSSLMQVLCICGQYWSDAGGSKAARWSHQLLGLQGLEGAAVSYGLYQELLCSLHPVQIVIVSNSSQKGAAAAWNTRILGFIFIRKGKQICKRGENVQSELGFLLILAFIFPQGISTQSNL